MPKPPGDTANGASPFVTKLEAWLRFANMPYTYVGMGDPSKAPKGQVCMYWDALNLAVASDFHGGCLIGHKVAAHAYQKFVRRLLAVASTTE